MTVQELYDREVRPLAETERRQLAGLILRDLDLRSAPGYSDEWTDEDIRDFTLHSLRRAASSFGEDGEDA